MLALLGHQPLGVCNVPPDLPERCTAPIDMVLILDYSSSTSAEEHEQMEEMARVEWMKCHTPARARLLQPPCLCHPLRCDSVPQSPSPGTTCSPTSLSTTWRSSSRARPRRRRRRRGGSTEGPHASAHSHVTGPLL